MKHEYSISLLDDAINALTCYDGDMYLPGAPVMIEKINSIIKRVENNDNVINIINDISSIINITDSFHIYGAGDFLFQAIIELKIAAGMDPENE